jgi:putative transposase
VCHSATIADRNQSSVPPSWLNGCSNFNLKAIPTIAAKAAARYRQLLYVSGEVQGIRTNGRPVKKGFSTEVVEYVIAQKGKLPLNEILRSRIRYFTDGAIIESKVFVEEAFGRHRAHFSEKREAGAKRMKGGDWGDLFTARQLRVDIFGIPAAL